MTASKPELSQSNFTAPPVSRKIPRGGREGKEEKGRESERVGRREIQTMEKFSGRYHIITVPAPSHYHATCQPRGLQTLRGKKPLA